MEYEIWNFGPSRKFPGPAGNVEILRGTGIETEDKELAEYMRRFPRISVKEMVDYSSMKRNALVSLAVKKGIKQAYWIKNAELIEALS